MKSNKTKIFEATKHIVINIPVEHFTVKELIFMVNEIPKNDSEKIEEVFNIISIMKKEIKELQVTINTLKNLNEVDNKKENNSEEYKNLIVEIKNMKEEIKFIKEENKNIKEENKNIKEEIKLLIEENKNILEENKNIKEEKKNSKEENKNILEEKIY